MIVDVGRSSRTSLFQFFDPAIPRKATALPPTPAVRASIGFFASTAPLTRVRWYFAPAGALPLPMGTIFAGTDFNDAQENCDVVYGERPYQENRRWNNGKAPAGALGKKYCGRPDDFLRPKVWSDTLPSLPRSPSGLPLCCNAFIGALIGFTGPATPDRDFFLLTASATLGPYELSTVETPEVGPIELFATAVVASPLVLQAVAFVTSPIVKTDLNTRVTLLDLLFLDIPSQELKFISAFGAPSLLVLSSTFAPADQLSLFSAAATSEPRFVFREETAYFNPLLLSDYVQALPDPLELTPLTTQIPTEIELTFLEGFSSWLVITAIFPPTATLLTMFGTDAPVSYLELLALPYAVGVLELLPFSALPSWRELTTGVPNFDPLKMLDAPLPSDPVELAGDSSSPSLAEGLIEMDQGAYGVNAAVCALAESPLIFSVHVSAPGYDFDGFVFRLTAGDSPTGFEWRGDDVTTPAGTGDLAVDSPSSSPGDLNLAFIFIKAVPFHVITADSFSPFAITSCNPWSFTVTLDIYIDGVPSGDQATFTLLSIP